MELPFSLKLLLTMVALLLYSNNAESQWIPHHPSPSTTPTPLCATQMTLVNHYCSVLPYTPVPPPSPPSPPSPTPEPPSPDGPDNRRRRGHRHGHGHRSRRTGRTETPAEEECCRWLKEVDDVCVCDLLVHLPPFLTRPMHNYTVLVDETCDVTFECGSRWLQL